MQLDGDQGVIATVLALAEAPDPNFNVVTP